MSKPRIGIFSLTGCGGDQLQILNMEDALLELLSRFQIVDFQEGSSIHDSGPIDISFVEGSVSTQTDLKRLKSIRERSGVIIAIGNCAIDGCIQAMTTSEAELKSNLKEVYGVEDGFFDAIPSKGIGEYVKIDYQIPGCPVEKEETLNAIISLLHGNSPLEYTYPVCVECKLNEYPCLITEKGLPCLGPVVRAGCDARCPGLGLDCIGCRGPTEGGGNVAAEYKMLLDKGYSKEFIINRLKVFSGDVNESLLEVI